MDKQTSGLTGKLEHQKWESGVCLSRMEAMKAKCFECMCHYDDGRQDCEVYKCPMYPYMPYGSYKRPKTRPSPSKDQLAKMRAGKRQKNKQ